MAPVQVPPLIPVLTEASEQVTLGGSASRSKYLPLETVMALRFLAIDPDTNGENCPALFLEEETGDLLFQGWTVTDPATLAESDMHSPLADNESLVRLPARMRDMIMEALHDGAAVQRADRGDDAHSGASGDQGRLHA
jgi:hypothetical protein